MRSGIEPGVVPAAAREAALAANARMAAGDVVRAVEASNAFNASAAGPMRGAFGKEA